MYFFFCSKPLHTGDRRLLLIRVSHPSLKVNCSVVFVPLSLRSCWLITGIHSHVLWSVWGQTSCGMPGATLSPSWANSSSSQIPILQGVPSPDSNRTFWRSAQRDGSCFITLIPISFWNFTTSVYPSLLSMKDLLIHYLPQVLQSLPSKVFHIRWLPPSQSLLLTNPVPSPVSTWNTTLPLE